MNNEDEQLDGLLSTVKVRPPSPNLAERIISASRDCSGQETASIFSLIANSLLLLKPAPALVCTLMIGFLSGWYINTDTGQNDLTVENELMEFIDYEIGSL